MLAVSDTMIEEAEKILFDRTGMFDEERRRFIKEWESCDLQAVPGSGKTTTLLAKLIVLEKMLPLQQNSSILVLSHTNAAVDEIRKKIGKHCPRLFTEPHFIGTIQSFVDRFLAIPYYIHRFKKKPIRIDDEIYREHHFIGHNLRYWLKNRSESFTDTFLYKSRLLDQDTLGFAFCDDAFPLKDKTSKSYQELLKVKRHCLHNGFLCFDDAYLLAFDYISKIPAILAILQKRFRYVFVDEMQDMDRHQYDILEAIFGDPGCPSVIQRIGDTNQAIFNEEAKLQDIWQPRAIQHQLNGSHRLHPLVASVVQRLALRQIVVNGLAQQRDGRPIQIKPHLLVYKDTTITNVIAEYARLIEHHRGKGEIPPDAPAIYKAICWTTKKEKDKIRISDFYAGYSKEQEKPKIAYSGLESHLYLHQGTFSSIRKSILNAFVYVLRKVDVQHADGRIFSKRTLLQFLKDQHPRSYSELQLHLYRWARLILSGQHQHALAAIKSYIPPLLALWQARQLKAFSFIANPYTPASMTSSITKEVTNCCYHNGIPIEVTTVHAVKGQTHTATLYLESFYQKSIKKSGNYESERLASLLKGEPLSDEAHEFVKQSMKMAYVGFSRPTHLLCFAVHEDRYRSHLHDLCTSTWEIIQVPENAGSLAAQTTSS